VLEAATFEALSLSPATRAALAAMEIRIPTPIQAQTLPALLAGRDVIGQARTGSGKTLAFGIPLVERCGAGKGAAQALVLTPTRELASQVASVVARLGRGHRLRVVELVGGRGYGPQEAALRGGAEVVVGTPGRVLDHLKQGTLALGALTYLVLDEADEMLDQGFGPDVDRIIGFIPESARRRQHALFSATLPEWAREIAARLLADPVVVQVDEGKSAGVAPESVDHVVYDVADGAKPAVLRALLDEGQQDGGATLVFGRTKHGVKKLANQLEREGYAVAALQANLSQNARDRVIASFRKGEVPILVATNVAARGLDIADLGRVINFDLPENGALFTHRVGRTGRMGRAGQAITLLAPEDHVKWRRLEKELKAAGLSAAFPRRPWAGPLPAVPATEVTAPAAPVPVRAARVPVRQAPRAGTVPPPRPAPRQAPAAPVNVAATPAVHQGRAPAAHDPAAPNRSIRRGRRWRRPRTAYSPPR
jgi:ATP-dependent RNA helicase DeaD